MYMCVCVYIYIAHLKLLLDHEHAVKGLFFAFHPLFHSRLSLSSPHTPDRRQQHRHTDTHTTHDAEGEATREGGGGGGRATLSPSGARARESWKVLPARRSLRSTTVPAFPKIIPASSPYEASFTSMCTFYIL